MNKINNIIYDDVVNGDGLGCVVFVQGCYRRCEQCHNPQTWNVNGGKEFKESDLKDIMDYFNKTPFATRLTLSGGEPIINELSLIIAKEFKKNFPEHQVWLFTGFQLDEILNEKLLDYVDVVIDGAFEFNKRDVTLKYRGSNNQRILHKEIDF